MRIQPLISGMHELSLKGHIFILGHERPQPIRPKMRRRGHLRSAVRGSKVVTKTVPQDHEGTNTTVSLCESTILQPLRCAY